MKYQDLYRIVERKLLKVLVKKFDLKNEQRTIKFQPDVLHYDSQEEDLNRMLKQIELINGINKSRDLR